MDALNAEALTHYLVIGCILFGLGLTGFLARRNLIMMFLSTEMMFQGIAVCLIAFSKFHQNMTGQSMTIFLFTIAACEAALALGLVVLLQRRKRTLNADAWSSLQAD